MCHVKTTLPLCVPREIDQSFDWILFRAVTLLGVGLQLNREQQKSHGFRWHRANVHDKVYAVFLKY